MGGPMSMVLTFQRAHCDYMRRTDWSGSGVGFGEASAITVRQEESAFQGGYHSRTPARWSQTWVPLALKPVLSTIH